MSNDLRQALRQLAHQPLASALVVGALAFGIGANAAIFSLVDAVLFRPLPVERPAELVRAFVRDVETGELAGNSSYPVFADYRDGARSFAALAAYADWNAVHLTTADRPARLTAALASGGLFELLGVRPALGRTFGADDEARHEPVAVLSDAAWRRHFAADPGVVGRVVKLNGHPFTLIGVAPRGFHGLGAESAPDLWVPITLVRQVAPGWEGDVLASRRQSWLDIVGRLKPGVTQAQAQAELDLIARRRAAGQKKGEQDPFHKLLPAAQAAVDPYGDEGWRQASWILLSVVVLVLLVACADAAALLLARAERQRRDLAIRVALGASRSRLLRLKLVESGVIAAAAAGIGLWLAGVLVDLARALPAEALPLPADVATPVLDPRVLLFTALAAVATAVGFGLLPALRASAVDPLGALKQEPSRLRGFGLRGVFTVAQVALSCVLLVGAALLLRTLGNVGRIEPGYGAREALLANLDLSRQGYDRDRGAAFWQRLLDEASRLPGVQHAALTRTPPLQRAGMRATVDVAGYTAGPKEDTGVDFQVVSPSLFAALGIPVHAGRGFTAADRAGVERVAIVNDAMAERFWKGRTAVGGTIRDLGPADDVVRVVGQVPTTRLRTLREDATPAVFVPLGQQYMPAMTLVLRSAGPAEVLAPALHALVRRLDPELALLRVRTLAEQHAVAMARERVLAALLAGFAGLALLLAGAGLYGLVAHEAQARLREFALRVAIGARPREVQRLVHGRTARLVGAGLLLGLPAAAAAARGIAAWLHGVEPLDPVSFAAATLALLAASLIAGQGPALRAARVDPAAILRDE